MPYISAAQINPDGSSFVKLGFNGYAVTEVIANSFAQI